MHTVTVMLWNFKSAVAINSSAATLVIASAGSDVIAPVVYYCQKDFVYCFIDAVYLIEFLISYQNDTWINRAR